MWKISLLMVACAVLTWTPKTFAANGVIDKFAETLKVNTRSSLKTCQAETGATRADLESLKMKKVPDSKTGRCFLECLFNTVKLMDDGKFNKQGMILVFTPAMKGDLTKVSKLRKLSEVCEKEIGGKRYKNCEGGKKIVECVARNGQAYGIEFPSEKKI